MKTLKILTLALVATLPQLSTDIYLASLPSLAETFKSTMDSSQLSIAVYMLALTLTQLIWGALSDVIGRKNALFIGFAIAMLGSLLCLKAETLSIFIAGRFIQGLGNGSAAALFRAILRDMYSGEELASIGSYFANILKAILIVAPVLGGFFEEYFSWHASFVFLIAWTVLCLVMIQLSFKAPKEEKEKQQAKKISPKTAYWTLVKSPVFMICCFCNFLTYGGMFAWITSSSSLLVVQLGVSSVNFGLCSGFVGFGLVVGALFNGRFVKKYGIHTMAQTGWIIIISSGVLLGLGSIAFGASAPLVILSAFAFYLGSSFTFPNLNALAMTPFANIAGSASGLYSFIQLSGGALVSYFMASMSYESPVLLGAFFCASGLSALTVFSFQRVTSLEPILKK